uniref:Uncharacterized protein n=1 Tax=Panagrolaimus sp. PS1159 TaxID=55785 RepID=A0AC35GJF1_9BILA
MTAETFKAHSNIGIFKTLTTDPRIFSPNSDALISIKFTFRKKVLKLNDLDSNALELDEKFIAKSQFAITEIEMGQWILVSVSAKSNLENNVLKLELIQEFLESYFTNPESSEIPNEASDFLYKFVTSETINLQQKNPSVSFKEFFESLKRTYEKHRCFPISVKLTSLLDLGFFTIDNRLETLQNSKFNSHKYFLKFFRESLCHFRKKR